MRIISGRSRGRSIVAPKGMATRPTTDRVRENLFNLLANKVDFHGLRVLDLFAGSGALGLEALSRGAATCLFVETDKIACTAIQSNIEALSLQDETAILRRDATRMGAADRQPFDLAFADPPYKKGLGQAVAHTLAKGGWINSGAFLVIEEATGALEAPLHDFAMIERRNYGSTEISMFEFTGTTSIS